MARSTIEVTSLVVVLACLQACGANSSPASPDASTMDASLLDGEIDGGPSCSSNPPSGKQIVTSSDPLAIFAVTKDGHAIYEDLTSQILYAVATSGGMPKSIGKMTSQGQTIAVRGAALLYLPTGSDPTTNIAPLSSWKASTGTSVISRSALALDAYDYTYDISSDGSYLAYFSTTDGMAANLTISTIDGTNQTQLVSDIDLTNHECFPPTLQFVGTTLVAQYCLTPAPVPDVSTLVTFAPATTNPPSFPETTLGTMFTPRLGALPQAPNGKSILFVGPSDSGLAIYDLATGKSTMVDGSGVRGFFPSTAAGDIIYTTMSGALMRYTASSGATKKLVPSGVNFALFPSPDGKWLEVADMQNSTTGLFDLRIASTTAPGPLTTLLGSATGSTFGFTADSVYTLFGTDFPTNFGPISFELQAAKTVGGTPQKLFSASFPPLYTSNSKFISNTNQSKLTGAADIVSVDLSKGTTPTVLVTQADPNLFLASPSELVYSWYCEKTAEGGIWTLTPP